ncbi:MAG TPA: lipopolysaccharide heptosyltransferase II [bacterium]|nr:lipopolysaccharide heptosyltransferase II [bacterium]
MGGRLLIRMPNWLGDCVMATKCLAPLKGYFKDITILASRNTESVFKNNPYVSRVISYDRKSFKDTLRAAAEIRKRGIKTGVSLTPSFSSCLVMMLGGVRARFGYDSDLCGLFLKRAYKRDREHGREHVIKEFEKIFGLMNGFDFRGTKQFLYAGDRMFEKQVKKARGLKRGVKGVVIAPFARYGDSKIWPFDRYEELIRMLLKKRLKVFITGLAEDRAHGLAADIRKSRFFTDLRGAPLEEIKYILANSSAFIGNDSGIMHMADALNVPCVVIFGATAPGWGGPVQAKAEIFYAGIDCQPCFDRKCRFGHYNCLKEIKAADVYKAALKLLKKRV